MAATACKVPRASAVHIASWYCVAVLVALFLLINCLEEVPSDHHDDTEVSEVEDYSKKEGGGGRLICEEIYEVGEGETLNGISEKCGDPFIVENNPHIHDPDDVLPGLLIKITPPP